MPNRHRLQLQAPGGILTESPKPNTSDISDHPFSNLHPHLTWQSSLKEVVFVLFDARTYKHYRAALEKIGAEL